MQSMQRQFGKLLNKGPGENAKVAVLLNDFEDADGVLAKIIDDAKMWRDSWAALVSHQLQVVTEYESLYDPIVGASDGHQSRQAVPTPPLQLERTFSLKKAYTELQADMVEEMVLIDEHVVKPATDARESIAPIRKTIKKRENKRLDYEKAQERALKLQRKSGRTPKEDAALIKADAEMSRAADEFSIADDHIRETLPPIITATFSLITPLVSNLVMIQNRLLGLYYTALHGYCEDFGFPSPPPPMQDVVATWNNAFGPIRSQTETISFIARGTAVRQPMSAGNGLTPSPGPATKPTIGARRTTTGLISGGPQARTLRTPSMPLLQAEARNPTATTTPSPSWKPPSNANATDFTTATILGGSTVNRSANGGLTPQRSFYSSTSPSSSSSQLHINVNGSLVKKKPPPPPPPKRPVAAQPEEWVVALYPFAGAGQGGNDGDLSFQEGDRIKVVKRTGTDQDWWIGELGGVRGNFPANYCRPL